MSLKQEIENCASRTAAEHSKRKLGVELHEIRDKEHLKELVRERNERNKVGIILGFVAVGALIVIALIMLLFGIP